MVLVTILQFCLSIALITAFIVKWIEWYVQTDYKLTPDQYKQAHKTKFCIVGGGVSGILVGYFFKLMRLDFVIIERGENIGGTWHWNTYPGVGCDIASHLYSFSWFRNPNWSKRFSLGDEIQQYIVDSWNFAGLKPYTMLNTEVPKAIWRADLSKWLVTIKYSDGSTEDLQFDWLISCVGGLHYPLFPKIKGIDSFRGDSWHTTRWNHKISLNGKKVGMIGVGASAVQILPSLLDEAEKVVLFQRTAHYVFPRFQYSYSQFFKKVMAVWPFGLLMRWLIYLGGELRWLLFFSPSVGNSAWSKNMFGHFFQKFLNSKVKDENLREKLKPTFKLGCKRILVSDEYYERMNDSHFHLDASEILEIDEHGIKTADSKHDLDVIIYATGFLIKENFDWVLDHNKTLKEEWEKGTLGTYYGTFHKGLPNFATFLGPMTALGSNSIIFILECQMQLLINVLKRMWSNKTSIAHASNQAIEEQRKEWEERIDKSTWAPSVCTNYYQRGSKDGRPWGLWPGSTIEYWWRTKYLDLMHFEFYNTDNTMKS